MYDHLPLVGFQYPDSNTDDLVQRLVRVAEMDVDYVKGYEVYRNNKQQPKFKKYKLSRIVSGGVHLLQFSPK